MLDSDMRAKRKEVVLSLSFIPSIGFTSFSVLVSESESFAMHMLDRSQCGPVARISISSPPSGVGQNASGALCASGLRTLACMAREVASEP